MAFPTLGQIAALRQPSGIETLGNMLSSGYQAYQQADARKQQSQAMKAKTQGEAQAANFLKQAVAEQDPVKSEGLVAQAFQASPDMVQKFFSIQKDRATGGDKMGLEMDKLDLRREEARLRALERADRKETNELKRKELQQKILLQKEKVSQALEESKGIESKKQSSVQMATEAAGLAKEIADSEYLGDITGTITTDYPAIRESSQDLINKADRLQSLLTVDNLKLMSGVLTDRDIKFLTNVASGLNIAEGGIKGSEKGVRNRLNEISKKIS
ncbi:MAG: hypothetical protein GY799_04975, partial [Desulfobulbaceae bacterium]|nr:hypothetical protein [Desulfobulbaceae bacterium]